MKRDEYYEQKLQYYEQKIKYNEEALHLLKDFKKILNNLNLQYGKRNESMD